MNKAFTKRSLVTALSLVFATPIAILPLNAQAAEAAKPAAEQQKKKTIADLLKNTVAHPGLFDMYQSKEDGTLYMKLKRAQLGKEYIHFIQSADGLPEVGQFRGAYWGSRLYSIDRYFNRIEIRSENTSFYFDPSNPLSKAKDANINRPVLASVTIEAEDEKSGDVLIKASGIFLSESLRQVKPSANPDAKPGEQFPLGNLNADKTKPLSVHNYPANTDLVVEYVYDNPQPVRKQQNTFAIGEFAITDDRSVSLRLRHSFIEMPKNTFQPRLDDPRVGYFGEIVQDMTAADATPYRDMISRWHLEKKNPGAALSEPVEPIVWWIENTTPHEYRKTIADAVLAWNSSFEKAGFKNAMQVKVQPDNADWDAGDIRYNVLRWTSSPTPLFSGYGPSFTNPRTGQILGADIMLEYTGITRRQELQNLFNAESLNLSLGGDSMSHAGLYEGAQFGSHALLASGASAGEVDQFVKEFLYYLVLHEVGHTLGLNHNMKASQMIGFEDIHDHKKAEQHGLTGSVMDYPAINFSPDGKAKGNYYTVKPGPYDDWAIEFGYSEALNDPAAEQKRLDTILARSTEPQLTFGNDADDMRSPGAGIDPRVMIYDMSGDAVSYAEQRLETINTLFGGLKSKLAESGDSYQQLTNGFVALNTEYARNTQVVSRYVGGVYVDRGFAGQSGAVQPFTPVPKAKQQQAMDVLSEFLFAPNAFDRPADLLTHLQHQRRSFNFFGQTEDPKLHDLALAMQKAVFDHLLHPVVLKRLQDSRLYGNEYTPAMMLNDLTEAVFAADAKGNVNSYRQNLQREYVNRLSSMLKKTDSSDQHSAQALARYQLSEISERLRTSGNNTETKAHKDMLKFLIKQALEPVKA
ncbi:zinc-dependent metalloprotease [Permianibacter aggregans]|uniref:Uncharacterized protein DUF5117 n=1 Tax=Permianibacter aggregans TaxID=1510150 RepID=A0A4R6UJU1_9GAMM|nr:zinc-dependent metalloprotease [Permianibacter aggregans]TDQ47111.1 uncharacterized protein DUF5117 [Permianibacter aggregans]